MSFLHLLKSHLFFFFFCQYTILPLKIASYFTEYFLSTGNWVDAVSYMFFKIDYFNFNLSCFHVEVHPTGL